MLSPQPEQEIWGIGDYFKDADLLKLQVDNISEWNIGQKGQINIQMYGQKNPSIQWLFRNEMILNNGSQLEITSPAIIISPLEKQLPGKDNYFGQEFVTKAYPYWKANLTQSFFSIDFFKWIFLRDGFINKETDILWVRNDLLIGNTSNSTK
jgi:hypothetical protein